jgi:hypothetical protein
MFFFQYRSLHLFYFDVYFQISEQMSKSTSRDFNLRVPGVELQRLPSAKSVHSLRLNEPVV